MLIFGHWCSTPLNIWETPKFRKETLFTISQKNESVLIGINNSKILSIKKKKKRKKEKNIQPINSPCSDIMFMFYVQVVHLCY